MTEEKFRSEIETLNQFFIIFCKDKHQNQKNFILSQDFNNKEFTLQSELCEECKNSLVKAIQHISLCPHEIKPRCRKCPNPCYEKNHWKQIAKIMRYSGIKLGLIKIKKVLFRQ